MAQLNPYAKDNQISKHKFPVEGYYVGSKHNEQRTRIIPKEDKWQFAIGQIIAYFDVLLKLKLHP
jgi:hypothetical protein